MDLTITFTFDGSAKPSQGSIGFALAFTDTGNRIVTYWGQPAGIDLQSYRSKICSLLAAVQLLRLIVEFNNVKANSSKIVSNIFKIYKDSQSMLKKLQRMNE